MEKYLTTFLVCMLALTLVRAQQLPSQPSQTQQQGTSQFPDGNAYKNAAITYKIIDVANNTYGYDVLVDEKLMIHQTSIPAMPGNVGFKTKDDATKVAKLVAGKIKKGEMPPTITTDELKKLHVIK